MSMSSGSTTTSTSVSTPPAPSEGARRRALEGIRILDITWVGAGPSAGRTLAHHGAEVIHIESRQRIDIIRRGPFPEDQPGIDRGIHFPIFNSGKLGVTINHGTPDGQRLMHRLGALCDVVITNLLPKSLDHHHLAYEDFRQVKPDIIYLSMPQNGNTGPYRDHPGVGGTFQGFVGISELLGWPDRAPLTMNTPWTDWLGPVFANIAILAALRVRRETGQGQFIDLSQGECAIHCLETAILDYTMNGRIQRRTGNRHQSMAPHGVYPCQGVERWITIAVGTDEEWRGLCRVAEEHTPHQPWMQDRRFATMLRRLAHAEELDEQIAAWTRRFTAEDLMRRLQAAGVPAGVVQNAADVLADPQLTHRGHFTYLDHAELGMFANHGTGFILSHTPRQIERSAPLFGEHNFDICVGLLGLSDTEFAELVDAQVIW
jgi:benzylsuccinate CoA-transferase BbsF subunit